MEEKKSVSTSENKVSLKKAATPNFKISSRALIKIMPMKKLLKKTFSFEGETAFTAWNI